MKMPPVLCNLAYKLLRRYVMDARRPDQVIGRNGMEDPYMLRWWLFGTSRKPDRYGDPQPRRLVFGWCVYVHCFLRGDTDWANHDHPWDFWTWMFRGAYAERRQVPLPDGEWLHFTVHHAPGEIVRRKATDLHRVELNRYVLPPFVLSQYSLVSFPWMSKAEREVATRAHRELQTVFTLFATFKWQRDWGFQCPQGWKHWRDVVFTNGCGET